MTLPEGVTEFSFYGCSSLQSLVIPEGVTALEDSDSGNGVLQGCTSLAAVELPSTLRTIGRYTFRSCESLASITLPAELTTLGEYAFSGCSALESINIPGSITVIPRSAFYECSALTGARLNDGTTTIEESAFSGCDKLSYVYVPASVTTISRDAFGWGSRTLTLWGASGSYAETYAKQHDLTFQDTTVGEVTYRFRAGKTVKITAVPDTGWHFVNWSCAAGNVTFADANSAVTTFVMPSAEVTVTATFAADEAAD